MTLTTRLQKIIKKNVGKVINEMQAVILAAGMGKRLQEYTKNNTKCMVDVNGETLVQRLLNMLDKKGLSRIVVVIGYEGQKLINYIGTLGVQTPIEYVDNPIYDKTNNIYSLALAKDYLVAENTLLFESDIIFDEDCIDCLIEDERDNLALVDKYEGWMDGTCMVIDDDDNIVDFVSGKRLDYSCTDDYYKTVNIYKFSKEFSELTYVPFLEAYKKSVGNNEYYETVIRLIAMLPNNDLKAKRLNGQCWYEIDDIQDLDIAESLFTSNKEEKYNKVMARYGGFWRYPGMLDFCYLVNPYFPTDRMKAEIKARFDELLCQYPSGMGVNSLVASRNFGVKKEHIVVGNGAAELIKAFMEHVNKGKVGVIKPTFEEYPNRLDKEDVVTYIPKNDDFSYTADDLMRYFGDNHIDTLLLINPDNPSGNYIPRNDVIRLVDWCNKQNISFLLDESFVDFSDEFEGLGNSLIEERIIERYSKLYIMKSISKSYGIPGARLGILVSSDEECIAKMKKDVSIWNINSFGEYFMQLYVKYSKEYIKSLEQIKNARNKLYEDLKTISYLRPIKSQANYIMCEILNNKTSSDIAEKLVGYNMLVKTLDNKVTNGKKYIRVAVRDYIDNEKLITILAMIGD